MDSIDWDRVVENYRDSNASRWPYRQLGPEPGYSGCRAPSAVLEKYGYVQQKDVTSGPARSLHVA